MQQYTSCGVIFVLMGTLLLAVNWLVLDFFEPVVFIGYLLFFTGATLLFVSLVTGGKDKIKIIGIIFFFAVLLFVTLVKPMELVYLAAWLKNLM